MELQALASGSSGNAYLVRHGRQALLVDAGISPRRLTNLLHDSGIAAGDLGGILVTHEHADHVRAAISIGKRFDAPVVASRGTLRAMDCPVDVDQLVVRAGVEVHLGDFQVWPIGVSHDAAEPLAFRIMADGSSFCIATDFGRVDERLGEGMRGADLAILEANHDENWLWNGHYPWFLKRRVASDVGHISNTAAADLLVSLADRAPRMVWLAHLSVHNNSPTLALETVSKRLRRAGRKDVTLRVLERHKPSVAWGAPLVPTQLSLGLA